MFRGCDPPEVLVWGCVLTPLRSPLRWWSFSFRGFFSIYLSMSSLFSLCVVIKSVSVFLLSCLTLFGTHIGYMVWCLRSCPGLFIRGPNVSAFGLSLNFCRFRDYGLDLDLDYHLALSAFIQFLCWIDCKSVILKRKNLITILSSSPWKWNKTIKLATAGA